MVTFNTINNFFAGYYVEFFRRCDAVRVERSDAGGKATLGTARMKVRVDLGTGRVALLDAHGAPVLVERESGRSLVPAEVQGERTFQARQESDENDGEALYGLGQQQIGLLDLKGHDLDLWQRNATVIVPFLVSSRGYGILWDNTSYTRFGWAFGLWQSRQRYETQQQSLDVVDGFRSRRIPFDAISLRRHARPRPRHAGVNALCHPET